MHTMVNIVSVKTSPPPPRSSAIGPLTTMSHVERSVICLHCQKPHSPGFMWNFSDTVRVCFTCYREMGEEMRKKYERGVVKSSEPEKAGYAMKVVSILALLIAILGASAYFFYWPLAEGVAEHRVQAGESQVPAGR